MPDTPAMNLKQPLLPLLHRCLPTWKPCRLVLRLTSSPRLLGRLLRVQWELPPSMLLLVFKERRQSDDLLIEDDRLVFTNRCRLLFCANLTYSDG